MEARADGGWQKDQTAWGCPAARESRKKQDSAHAECQPARAWFAWHDDTTATPGSSTSIEQAGLLGWDGGREEVGGPLSGTIHCLGQGSQSARSITSRKARDARGVGQLLLCLPRLPRVRIINLLAKCGFLLTETWPSCVVRPHPPPASRPYVDDVHSTTRYLPYACTVCLPVHKPCAPLDGDKKKKQRACLGWQIVHQTLFVPPQEGDKATSMSPSGVSGKPTLPDGGGLTP
ncbi:hypothetical protein MAPG_10368 [Magnaporthiopsis poae ATCC 64411]|uniref:Uncharacterized protein n=1 Tax=Magnaporthiopsis poae (strain ATCC 64411 / 73-15) TaxID=644358 RepID=A0A0C4ECE7_MAGP6|nr:hypothetical protein MAPG_10368 [Magnaporthiopsis poae ATCC 64411]